MLAVSLRLSYLKNISQMILLSHLCKLGWRKSAVLLRLKDNFNKKKPLSSMEYDTELWQSSKLITTPFLHFLVNKSGQLTVLQKMICSPGFHLTTSDTLVLLDNVPIASMFYLQVDLSNMCYHILSTANWIQIPQGFGTSNVSSANPCYIETKDISQNGEAEIYVSICYWKVRTERKVWLF